MQEVSAEITVKIDFKSVHEMNTCIEEIEKMLQTDRRKAKGNFYREEI